MTIFFSSNDFELQLEERCKEERMEAMVNKSTKSKKQILLINILDVENTEVKLYP